MIPAKPITEEEKARRQTATARVIVRLINGQWECDMETESFEGPISGKELKRILRTVQVAHKKHLGAYRVTLRRQEPALKPV